MKVRAKKSFGQHFLNDESIARRIAESVPATENATVLEIGPGMGVLTQPLFEIFGERLYLIEVDRESVSYLKAHFLKLSNRLFEEDFLKFNYDKLPDGPVVIAGNFPYNISSQIVFSAVDNRNRVAALCGMFQKELAERICADPGSKTYGVITVLTQAFFHAEYLFTVEPESFDPPPKVRSGILRLTRYRTEIEECSYSALRTVVKTAFQQRRKTLRNALKSLNFTLPEDLAGLRPEKLSVQEFIELAKQYENTEE